MADSSNNEPCINIISTSTLGARSLDHDPNQNINMNINVNTMNINNNVNLMHNSSRDFSPNARNFNVNCRSRRDGGYQRGRGMFMPFICIIYVLLCIFLLLYFRYCLIEWLIALFLNRL